MKPLNHCVPLAAVALLAGCGSSPTEPSSSSARTSLKITVTQCSLGGSVTVRADDGTSAVLMTPGEVTLMLAPGPRSLTYTRGNDVFGGSIPPDALGAIPPGSTATIALVDPPGACFATAH